MVNNMHVYVHVMYTHVQCTCTCIFMYTVEPLYCGHHWDRPMCPDYRGVLIIEVLLYTEATFGTPESVLIIEVSLFQCPD